MTANAIIDQKITDQVATPSEASSSPIPDWTLDNITCYISNITCVIAQLVSTQSKPHQRQRMIRSKILDGMNDEWKLTVIVLAAISLCLVGFSMGFLGEWIYKKQCTNKNRTESDEPTRRSSDDLSLSSRTHSNFGSETSNYAGILSGLHPDPRLADVEEGKEATNQRCPWPGRSQ